MRGTNFCTDALLGAIYAELGLMAVTAETTPGGEKASSALPEAAACADRTPCSSASACTPVLTRLGYGCNVRTSEPRRTPSRTSLRTPLCRVRTHQASAAGTFRHGAVLNLVCLNDAVAVTVGDDATGVATAGHRRGSGRCGPTCPTTRNASKP